VILSVVDGWQLWFDFAHHDIKVFGEKFPDWHSIYANIYTTVWKTSPEKGKVDGYDNLLLVRTEKV
jgi:hypothetical protein